MLLRKLILTQIFCFLSGFCEEIDKSRNNTNENFFSFDNAEPLVASGELGSLRVTPVDFENDPRIESFVLSLQQIHCYSEHMVVYLQRNILENAGLTIKYQLGFNSGSNHDESCFPLDKVTNSTHFVIATLYTMCGTTKIKTRQASSNQVIKKNQIIFKIFSSDNNDTVRSTKQIHPDRKSLLFTVTQDVYCTTDLRKLNSNVKRDYVSNEIFDEYNFDEETVPNSKFTFRLQLYDNRWIGNPWIKYPKVVYQKQTVYAQILLNQSVKDDDLRPLIKECYFSQKSNPIYEPRFSLISSGCPVVNSALVHSRSPSDNQISRFTFETSQYFDNTYMFFHCHVTVCSYRGERENEGFDKCPSSTACTEKRVVSTSSRLANSVTSYVSSGPIRPISVEGEKPLNRNDHYYTSIVTSTTCPPCPTYQAVALTESHQNFKSQPQRQIILTNGMSIYTVVGIAFASFLLGIALMGGLWKAHELTEPKKFTSRLHKRNNMNDFTSKENNYSLEPTMPTTLTPMTESSAVSSKYSSNFTPYKQ